MSINNVKIGFILYVGEIKMFKYKVARKNNETIYSWFLRTCFKNGISPKELFLFEYSTIYCSIVSNIKVVIDIDEGRIDDILSSKSILYKL